jgi:translation initiation factor 2B subunit (eIF-2B alpha/beta/delta family)
MDDDERLAQIKSINEGYRTKPCCKGGYECVEAVDYLVARVEVLEKMAGDAISEVANLRQAYTTATYNHPDDDMRILTLGMSEALINRGRKILGWDQKGET